MGPCAKVTVICTIAATNGRLYSGQNDCENPQTACPRLPGEGYEKCTSICRQTGHAEMNALKAAGLGAAGATVQLKGHTWYCRTCQESLFNAGVKTLGIFNPKL